jgi:hypothetical protein
MPIGPCRSAATRPTGEGIEARTIHAATRDFERLRAGAPWHARCSCPHRCVAEHGGRWAAERRASPHRKLTHSLRALREESELVMRSSVFLSTVCVVLVASGCAIDSSQEDEVVDSANSAATATATAKLDRDTYTAGQKMTLTVVESFSGSRSTKITDTAGHAWTKTSDNGQTMTWTATAGSKTGQFKVTATITPSNGGATISASASYTLGTVVVPTKKALLGMSAPANLWDQRVAEVGPGLQARRIFLSSFTASLGTAQEACADGMYPVLSFKTGGYSWAQVAAGNADADLRALAARLEALPCDSFAAIHHEPAKDGAASDWAKMQAHALPIVGGAIGGKVKVGVIANGWWWSATNQGYTDAEIAAYIPPAVIAVSDVIASDTYQTCDTCEEPAPKMKRMAEWARRVGGVRALGIGEFNGHTAASITNAAAALGADPLFAWGCVWNSDGGDGGIATPLEGDRLEAFKKALANW